MISGQSFLCFAPGPWHDLWRSRHQIMSRLAQENTVLWVEPRLTLRQIRRSLGRESLGWLPRVEHCRDGLYVVHNPAILPNTGPKALTGLSNRLYQLTLRRIMKRMGMKHPILWLYLPEMIDIIGAYDQSLVVYHVVDEYSAYASIPASYLPVLRSQEEELLRRADVVFATAPALVESKGRLNKNTFLVPNAVDYDGFLRTLATTSTPPAMELHHPIIGYVGAINDKLDFDLLVALASSRPQWTLAMVGPILETTGRVQAGIDALSKLPNVHLLGQVSVPDVPRYIASCDVCILPYHINERTRNISSLKLYEYLACGKPVVATDIPAGREGKECVRIAGAQDFASAIISALAEGPEAAQARRRLAAANTWDQRVESISEILMHKGLGIGI